MSRRHFMRAVLSAVLAALYVPDAVSASGQARERYAQGRWRLVVLTDRFSGERSCRLFSRNGNMIYVANAVGFKVASKLDLSHSWFRIDGGVPLSLRDELPELARLRVVTEPRQSIQPGKMAWLPLSLLADARYVDISRGFGRRPRRFDLDGLSLLLSAGRDLGCIPEERFTWWTSR